MLSTMLKGVGNAGEQVDKNTSKTNIESKKDIPIMTETQRNQTLAVEKKDSLDTLTPHLKNIRQWSSLSDSQKDVLDEAVRSCIGVNKSRFYCELQPHGDFKQPIHTDPKTGHTILEGVIQVKGSSRYTHFAIDLTTGAKSLTGPIHRTKPLTSDELVSAVKISTGYDGDYSPNRVSAFVERLNSPVKFHGKTEKGVEIYVIGDIDAFDGSFHLAPRMPTFLIGQNGHFFNVRCSGSDQLNGKLLTFYGVGQTDDLNIKIAVKDLDKSGNVAISSVQYGKDKVTKIN